MPAKTKLRQQMKRIVPVIAASLLAPLAHAGIPSALKTENAKWMRVSPAWTIDSEDIEVRGDQIRFWVRRNAVGNEEMSTQTQTTWTGKLRVRCGDFHAKVQPRQTIYYYGAPVGHDYSGGFWEQIDQSQFAYELASNFCYLTGTAGYTPEPIVHDWQRKITATIKAAPKKKPRSRDGACDDGSRQSRCR